MLPGFRHGAALALGLLAALGAAIGCGEAPAPPPGATPAKPSAAPPAVSEATLPVNGTELYVKRMGAGEPIIVVHGGPVLEHGYLLPHLAPLAESYELIFFDQRLSGRSAGVVDPASVRLDTFAEDIEALRQQLGLGSVHLMGHSWGGLLAMRYAILHGEHLRSLILLDSVSASAALWQAEQQALAQLITDEQRAESQALRESEAIKGRQPAAIAKLLELSFRPQFNDPTKLDRLELYVPDDYMARSQQFGGLMVDLEAFDYHPQLAAVHVPALLLYGVDEPGAALGGAAIHRALPDSEMVSIENAGHFPFIEQPDAFLAAVRSFLTGVAAAH